MSKIFVVILFLLIVGFGVWFFVFQSGQKPAVSLPSVNLPISQSSPAANPVQNTADVARVSVVATGLDTPWAIAFLPASAGEPTGEMLVTERKGDVRLISSSGLQENPVANISSVREIGEGGLLGIAIDPDFNSNNYIYLYYTYQENNGNTLNRVVRMTLRQAQDKPYNLTDEQIIVDAIPGASNHDGGRIKFGPDKKLYIGTGDAQDPSRAQNTESLAGKILRIEDGRAKVYSYGHRNVQGLTWDQNGTMFATEHGRSGVLSGFDELNLIQQGKNYGWPDSQGDTVQPGTIGPIRHSGATNTWAPSGAAYLNNSVYFAGLRGQSLYQAVIQDNKVVDFKQHLKGEFGRIREVVVGPDNMLYITTSNRDGRGSPVSEDDRVIRVNPEKL